MITGALSSWCLLADSQNSESLSPSQDGTWTWESSMFLLHGSSGFGQPTIEWLPPGDDVAPATPVGLKESFGLKGSASLGLLSTVLKAYWFSPYPIAGSPLLV